MKVTKDGAQASIETAVRGRVVVYVDGFNLYHGMVDSHYRRFLWLDIERLAQSLLLSDQLLVSTKYFTARVSGPRRESSRLRQSTYLDAIGTTGARVYEGRFLSSDVECHRCGKVWEKSEEKGTDVNLAVEMVADALVDRVADTLLVVSADSDLVPAVRLIRNARADVRVVAAFPPKRHSRELEDAAHASLRIGRAKLSQCQFPDEVVTDMGFVLRRPSTWSD